ncbi:MAG TPA: hypothetical protein VN636_10520 [Acidimicrobiia bacterium]|nr:hypothetical protein [Acidimicrobiia bacterium]
MATRRTTSGKRQRERAKQLKAAAKRERRQERSTEDDLVQASTDLDDDLTTEQLVQRIEALHADYDAGTVTFEEFDEQKAELLDRIALRLAQ